MNINEKQFSLKVEINGYLSILEKDNSSKDEMGSNLIFEDGFKLYK